VSFSKEELLEILAGVCDPEIPVINIVEMGIVRDVELIGKSIRVDITPTYSGCPAMKVIQDDIVSALHSKGFKSVSVNTVYTPAWTTAWLGDTTKQKLKEYGIAPPKMSSGNVIVLLPTKNSPMSCPFCDSSETELRSEFGSTACKSFYYCNNCKQPFEHFKEI
jgi:ring-1,2-phenylacetyl-CoA epoxidase subunit PaaD